LGTAFPHLLKNRDFDLPWKSVLYFTSVFAMAGGALMLLFVGDGPYRKKSGKFQWNAFAEIFGSKKWRQAALTYFGHMWEVYTFWGFLPVIVGLYAAKNHVNLNIPLLSFIGIAIGAIGSIIGGYLSHKWGSAKVAFFSLLISGICCLLSPLIFSWPLALFLIVIFTWGFTVVPDSPQLSTLVAQYAPEHLRGTALTINNSIGFFIATASLFIIDRVFYSNGYWGNENTFLLLGLGALVGLPFMIRLLFSK
jgi:MFS family permease